MPGQPTHLACPVCLGTARHSTDRKGGQYLACAGCGSRVFIKGGSTFGLDLVRVAATHLGGERLRTLQQQLGSTVVLAALAQVLRDASIDLGSALEHQLTHRAWSDLFEQLDQFLPDEEPTANPRGDAER